MTDFNPDESDVIAMLEKHNRRLEAALRGVVNANDMFLRNVPHMRNEPAHDPISKACEQAKRILFPETETTVEEFIDTCYRDTGHHASCSFFDPEKDECDCGLEIGLRF